MFNLIKYLYNMAKKEVEKIKEELVSKSSNKESSAKASLKKAIKARKGLSLK